MVEGARISPTYVAILIEDNATGNIFLQTESDAFRYASSFELAQKQKKTCALYLYDSLGNPRQPHLVSG